MKKVKTRAVSALIIAGCIVIGLCLYIIRYFDDGEAWASFQSNRSVFSQGVLDTGTVTDRNGIVLAHAGDGIFYYADDAAVRRACFHVVGDYSGNVGTGVLTAFASRVAGYNPINGTYSADGTGGELELSIDSSLNTVAYNALNGRNGSVLVMDYTTGEILCMVSSPSYDPASPPSDLSGYDGVYINRAISATFAPGSIFKLITLTAAIENVADLYSRSFYCAGSVSIGGGTVTCSGTHGTQTVEQAFANSCNCAFAALSVELGGELIAEYAEKLGITTTSDLDGIITSAGSFDVAQDGSTDLAWSGIGQYNDLVSPYSMLRLVAAVANSGTVKEPTLLLGGGNGTTGLISGETAGKLADMMSYNVIYGYGTWNFPDLSICAKSGTAEIDGKSSHAWFVGFLDDDEHPLAFVVMVENGGGGLSVAGSVANTVLQAAVSS